MAQSETGETHQSEAGNCRREEEKSKTDSRDRDHKGTPEGAHIVIKHKKYNTSKNQDHGNFSL